MRRKPTAFIQITSDVDGVANPGPDPEWDNVAFMPRQPQHPDPGSTQARCVELRADVADTLGPELTRLAQSRPVQLYIRFACWVMRVDR